MRQVVDYKRMEYWDRQYKVGTPKWDRDYVSPVLEYAVDNKLITPCTVISLGCGSGTNECYLAKKGFAVTGLDLSQTALDIAKSKSKLDINWIQGDVLDLPKDIGQYDLIFDRGCYHNIRYAYASEYVATIQKLSHPNSQSLIISCNSPQPPGVTQQHMFEDFNRFKIKYLEEISDTDQLFQAKRNEWLLLLGNK